MEADCARRRPRPRAHHPGQRQLSLPPLTPRSRALCLPCRRLPKIIYCADSGRQDTHYACRPWQQHQGLKLRLHVQVVVVGLIVGSLFSNQQPVPSDARNFFGVSFIAIMFLSFGAQPELSICFDMKP